MEKQLQNRFEGESPFKGWLAVFLLFHALLSLGLISRGLMSIAAYLKAGNFLGLFMLGYFFLPASILLFINKKKVYFPLFILYGVFFLISTIDPANFSQSLLAGVISTVIIFVPWLIYLLRSERVKAFIGA